MRISQLIDELNKLKDYYEDLEVGDEYELGFSSNFDIGVCQIEVEDNNEVTTKLVVLLHWSDIVKLIP